MNRSKRYSPEIRERAVRMVYCLFSLEYTAFSLSNIDHTKFFDTMQWLFIFSVYSMLHRLQLTVPVINNNIHIIRMLLKCSIPGNIQNQGLPRDFVIYST